VVGGRPATTARIDADHRRFYDRLAEAGVTVVDLAPDLIALRDAGKPAYLKTDSHWSPAAVEVAVERIAGALRKFDDFERLCPPRARKQAIASRKLEVRGDLADLLKADRPPPEPIEVAGVRIEGKPFETDAASPLLLMGDSHVLVFHRELLADQAGLPDLLSAKLSHPIDVVASRGGGANDGRIALARRRDDLAGKRFVVWCLSAREFTESPLGWKVIPTPK
jgi:hypothetical protein